MKQTTILLIVLGAGLLCVSCGKDGPVAPDDLSWLDFVEEDTYYSEDISQVLATGINGVWEPISTSGGFAGTGYEINYNYLLIKPNAIFGIIAQNELQAYGRIVIDDTSQSYLVMTFEAEEIFNGFANHMHGSTHRIVFSGDTMDINTLHPDGFDTRLVKLR